MGKKLTVSVSPVSEIYKDSEIMKTWKNSIGIGEKQRKEMYWEKYRQKVITG